MVSECLYLGGPYSEGPQISSIDQQMEPNCANYEILILNIWEKWQAVSGKVSLSIFQISQPLRLQNMQAKMEKLRGITATSSSQRNGQPMGSDFTTTARKVIHHKFRTDNCVKNHFYSYFRKCIKNVNYSLSIVSERKLRPLKLNIINKIISFIQAYHHDPHNFDKNAYEDARGRHSEIQM